VDSVRCEREILKLFQSKYEKRRDIGSEYFEGDINDMIFDLYSCAQTSLVSSSEARLGNMNNNIYSCAQTSLMSSSEARLKNMNNNIQERANRLQNRQIQKDVLEMNQRNEKQTAAINFYRRIMFMNPLCTPMNLSPHNCVVYNLCIPHKNIAIVVPYTEKDVPYAPINNEAIKWINDREFSFILIDAWSEDMSVIFAGLKLMIQYCVIDKQVNNFHLSRNINMYKKHVQYRHKIIPEICKHVIIKMYRRMRCLLSFENKCGLHYVVNVKKQIPKQYTAYMVTI
jgi:hypothetical protein